MTDRELLELAAKACGLWDYKNGCIDKPWSPLTDDGDALRLVVKCKLHIGMESHTVQAWQSDVFGNFQSEVLSHRGDEAATRRAIVRAAAAIGKAMP